jgi:transposase-like protein
MKRLNEKQWQEIKELLQEPKRNISQICRKYKISRNSIYVMANKNGWLKGRNELVEANRESFWARLIKRWGKSKFKGEH